VRHQKRFGVGTDFVHNTVVFTEDEGKFSVVHLELFFLKEDDLSTLRDFDSNARQAFGLTNQCHDLRVEVHIEFVVVGMTNDQGGKETGLGLLDFNDPSLSPLILEVEESVGDTIVVLYLLHSFLGLVASEQVTWELLHWSRSSVEQVA